MTIIPYNTVTHEALLIHLKHNLPAYCVRTRFGNIQIRTSGFTLTGNVLIKLEKKAQRLRLTTNYDSRMIYWFFNWPVALYITSKKDKQLAMEKEVATLITAFTKTSTK